MTPEEQKNKLYEWLGREFAPVEQCLEAEGTTVLDGVLWNLAGKLQDLGMYKSFEIALLSDGKEV